MSATLNEPPRATQRGPDPLREVFDRMNEARGVLAGHDPVKGH